MAEFWNPTSKSAAVPAQQGIRRYQPTHPLGLGERRGQGGQDHTVGPVQLRLWAPHRHLPAQHQLIVLTWTFWPLHDMTRPIVGALRAQRPLLQEFEEEGDLNG